MPSEVINIEIDEDLFLPCYRHLHTDTSDIRFLWGGRDSGKSQDIAMRKIVDCLRSDYFREILIKKTSNSIKDSQWQTIKDICADWGIDHLFSFTTHPLEITCTVNGNKFIARGCDDVGKLKSIRNPTGAWIEEGNQLSEDDLTVLLTTMRNDRGGVQIDISLNPEAEDVEYEEFYLYKIFFKKWCEQGIYTFKDQFEMKLPNGKTAVMTYSATHTTYHDNPHVTAQRIAFHESLQDNNPYYYNVFTLGMWGVRPAGNNPFATAYNPEIHESEEVVRNHHKQLFISIDFNLNPFAVTFSHIWQDSLGMHLHTFDEAEIGIGSIPAMIKLINGRYADQLHNCLMTGDSGGNKGDLSQSDQRSWFEQLRRGLNLRSKQVIVPGVPYHETSRSDCNYLLHHTGIPESKIDVKINPKNCPGLVRDLKNVQCDAFGSIVKRNRKDVNQRGDFLDCFVGETMVETSTGSKRIDSVEIGDFALTPDGYKEVADKWFSYAEVYQFTTSEGVNVTCTKDHKFFVDNVGWIEVFNIFNANLSIYNLLPSTMGEHTESKIISCEKIGMRKVWDITVKDSHCFYANGILVHNCHRYLVNTFLKKFILQHQKLNR